MNAAIFSYAPDAPYAIALSRILSGFGLKPVIFDADGSAAGNGVATAPGVLSPRLTGDEAVSAVASRLESLALTDSVLKIDCDAVIRLSSFRLIGGIPSASRTYCAGLAYVIPQGWRDPGTRDPRGEDASLTGALPRRPLVATNWLPSGYLWSPGIPEALHLDFSRRRASAEPLPSLADYRFLWYLLNSYD